MGKAAEKSREERYDSFIKDLKSSAKKNELEFITMNRTGLGIRCKGESKFILLADLSKILGVVEDIEY